MNAVATLESRLADLYAKLPHLPRTGRRWIATNAWWIVLVIAILTSLALLASLPALFALANFTDFSQVYPYSSVPKSLLITTTSISIAFGIASVVLLFAAVTPLKDMRRRGWVLLFIEQLLGIVLAVINFAAMLTSFGGLEVFSLLWALLLAALELYFLFEIRPEFSLSSSRPSKVIEGKTANKADHTT